MDDIKDVDSGKKTGNAETDKELEKKSPYRAYRSVDITEEKLCKLRITNHANWKATEDWYSIEH